MQKTKSTLAGALVFGGESGILRFASCRLRSARRGLGRRRSPGRENHSLDGFLFRPSNPSISMQKQEHPFGCPCFWRREWDSPLRLSPLALRAARPRSAALPGAGKPFAGWFSVPPFESLHLYAKTRAPLRVLLFLAERVGFEPTLPLRGKHDFQSCAFDQLSHLSTARFFRRNVYNTRMRSNLQAFFYSSSC